MAKKLKLAFAMGGGVSLGTFSGEGLTQCLKLALLFGCDENQEAYESIEVDVMSGASAGAISLSVMLRRLLAPTLSDELLSSHSNVQVKDVLDRLKMEFPRYSFESLQGKKLAQLVQVQILQDEQREIWRDKATVDNLLDFGRPNDQEALKYKASILDRGHLERLAKDVYKKAPVRQPSEYSLLGSRALVAMSLTGLTPIVAFAKDAVDPKLDIQCDIGGLTSYTHRETRVFDLHFNVISRRDNIETPSRWVRGHMGDEVVPDNIVSGSVGAFSLQENRFWSHVFSSALACGAFPLAFEPVPLTRYKFEYTENLMPKSLQGDLPKSAVFHYVDGGVFNNEPVREAFRLAAFLDARARFDNPKLEFDRRVLFIDPSVNDSNIDLNLGHLRFYAKPRQGLVATEVNKNNSLDKLLPAALSLVTALTNEASVVEENKISSTLDSFEARDKYLELFSLESDNPKLADVISLRDNIIKNLSEYNEYSITPSRQINLRGELMRVWFDYFTIKDGSSAKAIECAINTYDGELKIDESLCGVWWELLKRIAFDIMLSIEAKDKKAILIPISPVTKIDSPVQDGPKYKAIKLPGRYLIAFAGFTSDIPDAYEFYAARESAFAFMKYYKLLKDNATFEEPKLTALDFSGRYAKDFALAIANIKSRVADMIANSELVHRLLGDCRFVAKILDNAAVRFILGAFIKDSLPEVKKSEDSVSVQISIAAKDFSFAVVTRGNFKLNLKSISNNENQEVINLVLDVEINDDNSVRWYSDAIAIKGEPQVIEVCRHGNTFCYIQLPDKSKLDALHPHINPLFYIDITNTNKGEIIQVGVPIDYVQQGLDGFLLEYP